MTKPWPSSCSGAVSNIHRSRNAGARLALSRQRHELLLRAIIPVRGYATKNPRKEDAERPEKAALRSISQPSTTSIDPINPPRSTLPAPLTLPERGGHNIFMYYFRIGRAYGGFYWMGIKAVWFNRQAANALRSRVQAEATPGQAPATAMLLARLTRAEYQLLARNAYDVGKLPFFALLVALFGEWLPLLVPFIPSAVPGTCRIPQQIRGMREKAEERRRVSFRQGIAEPGAEQMLPPPSSSSSASSVVEESKVEWPMAQPAYAASLLARLRPDQLHHLSSTLNLHNRLWDRVQLPPPAFLLRRGLAKRLAYISGDDLLLTRYGGAPKLETDELMVACEQRGIDVLGRRADVLRGNLTWWLAQQQADQGKGSAIFTMLFRRLAIRDWVTLNVEANHRSQT